MSTDLDGPTTSESGDWISCFLLRLIAFIYAIHGFYVEAKFANEGSSTQPRITDCWVDPSAKRSIGLTHCN